MTDMIHDRASAAGGGSGGRFTGYRVAGALAAVLLFVALAVQVFELFDGDSRTVPEIRWGAPPVSEVQSGSSSIEAAGILRDRAELQGPRDVFGPAPGADRTFQVGSGTRLVTEEIETPSPFLTEAWSAPSAAAIDTARGSDRVVGISSLPYAGAEIFERPGARNWRLGLADIATHVGALAILGMAFLLALMLAIRGRVPIVRGKSGRTVRRFGTVERATHWMTGVSFLMLAVTGIVLAYGDTLILPFGDAALGSAGWLSTWGHMMFFPPFALGIVAMFVLWVRHNLPSRLDLHWLAEGGGMFSDHSHPPARKFNAGQKLIFWSVVLGGGVMVISGVLLMFPFIFLGLAGLSWAMLVHAIVGALLIAVIVGHIYIGSVGMEGAFWAMWSGGVDRNWAAEHHDLWLAEIESGRGGADR